MDNPLLEYANSPDKNCDFSLIRLAHFSQALDFLLDQAQKAVAECRCTGTEVPDTVVSTCISPIEQATEKLSKVWNILSHLHAVNDYEPVRELFTQYQEKVSRFWNELPQDHLYHLYHQIQTHPKFQDLSIDRQVSITHAVRDFKMGGVDLSRDKRVRFLAVKTEISKIETTFSNNVLDSSEQWQLRIEDPLELRGIPIDTLDEASELAEAYELSGWLLTLDTQCARNVIQYAENRFLRARFYQEYHVRASDMFKHPEFDNTPHMIQILKLRLEEANLLGYETYAHLATAPRMLNHPKQVFDFLSDLAIRIRPRANQEWQELLEFAGDLGYSSLQPYDVSFISEKLRQHRFSYNEDEVRQYFPLGQVLKGLFILLYQLFQVRFVPKKETIWANGVLVYEVHRNNQLMGMLYFDLYSRPHKQEGAWMQDIQNRISTAQGTQIPVAFLTCNFTPPKGSKGCFLSHDEIQTLLHEMGHGLHHLLTEIAIPSVGGMSGVEWDAVELPSQMLEQFAWRYEVLQLMSSHIETQHTLPKHLFEKMLSARYFQCSIQTLRQVALSLTDLWIHGSQIKEVDSYFLEWIQQVWVDANEYNVLPMSGLIRPLHSFSHIFSGGYSAGYYSYLWSDMLACDAYAAFSSQERLEEMSATGGRFVNEILAKGSSRSALSSFTSFRGREPKVDYFLHRWEVLDAHSI
jgi:oligopeptidase A